jgi:hypothetical protein
MVNASAVEKSRLIAGNQSTGECQEHAKSRGTVDFHCTRTLPRRNQLYRISTNPPSAKMENGEPEQRPDATAGFLEEIIAARVIVRLSSGIVYKGAAIFPSPDGIPITDTVSSRCAPVGGRLHERGAGRLQRVRGRRPASGIWRCVCEREQR